jgi:hypothetical protein
MSDILDYRYSPVNLPFENKQKQRIVNPNPKKPVIFGKRIINNKLIKTTKITKITRTQIKN